jgi:hypothetical protein
MKQFCVTLSTTAPGIPFAGSTSVGSHTDSLVPRSAVCAHLFGGGRPWQR